MFPFPLLWLPVYSLSFLVDILTIYHGSLQLWFPMATTINQISITRRRSRWVASEQGGFEWWKWKGRHKWDIVKCRHNRCSHHWFQFPRPLLRFSSIFYLAPCSFWLHLAFNLSMVLFFVFFFIVIQGVDPELLYLLSYHLASAHWTQNHWKLQVLEV